MLKRENIVKGQKIKIELKKMVRYFIKILISIKLKIGNMVKLIQIIQACTL